MLTKKRSRFCELYVLGHNATEAYKLAFGNTNATSSRVNASKLLKNPQISERISDLQAIIKKKQGDTVDAAIEDTTGDTVMKAVERMQILTQIARGEIQLTKPMVVDGIVQLIPVIPDWMDRKNAISELNKMDGSYAPTKTAHTDTKGNDKAAISIQVVSGLPEIKESE